MILTVRPGLAIRYPWQFMYSIAHTLSMEDEALQNSAGGPLYQA
jgi:hypothetical protein